MYEELHIEHDVPLAPHTTLEVGGPARHLAQVHTRQCLQQAFYWAKKHRLATYILGGGSNLLVSDDGFDGLVIKIGLPGVALQAVPPGVLVRCGAGVAWDTLCQQATDEGLAGIECLSGIPGMAGAAPVQNIGAYGQELSQVLQDVHVIDRQSGQMHILPQAALAMGYRSSQFKAAWYQRFAIAQIDLVLVPDAEGCTTYGELQQFLGSDHASVREVREAVLTLRRRKSMLWEADNENKRSVGSFFVNPIVSAAKAQTLRESLGAAMPVFALPSGDSKLSAGWLIEAAGFARGCVHGNVGLSTAHALCIVNRGSATAADVVDFAALLVRRVRQVSGLTLIPEPDLVGFSPTRRAALLGGPSGIA